MAAIDEMKKAEAADPEAFAVAVQKLSDLAQLGPGLVLDLEYALGATAGDVTRLVAAQAAHAGAVKVAAGVAIPLPPATVNARILSNQLAAAVAGGDADAIDAAVRAIVAFSEAPDVLIVDDVALPTGPLDLPSDEPVAFSEDVTTVR